MTEPTAPLFKQGDVVLLDGVVTTLHSWPADNTGPFTWERYDAQAKGFTRSTSWYNTNEAGEPLQQSAVVVAYNGERPPNTLGIDPDTNEAPPVVELEVGGSVEEPAVDGAVVEPEVEVPAE